MRRLLPLLVLGSALAAEDFPAAQKALEAALGARPGRVPWCMRKRWEAGGTASGCRARA